MQIFLFFNGFHSDFWDYFMLIFSDRFVWVPFYASFLFVMVRNFPIKVVLTTLIVITLIITLCDQTASGLLKPMIGRLRPSNPDNPISPMVHIVQGYRGGAYGFPSSHAANAWSMAFFCAISGTKKQTDPISVSLGADNLLLQNVSGSALFWRCVGRNSHRFHLCNTLLLCLPAFPQEIYG